MVQRWFKSWKMLDSKDFLWQRWLLIPKELKWKTITNYVWFQIVYLTDWRWGWCITNTCASQVALVVTSPSLMRGRRTDLGFDPWLGPSHGEGMAAHLVILACKCHGQRSPGLQCLGSRGHDCVHVLARMHTQWRDNTLKRYSSYVL